MPSPRETVGSVVGIMALLLIGVVLLGMVAGMAPSFVGGAVGPGSQTDDVPVLSGTGTIQTGQGVSVDNVTSVLTSLDDAVELTGTAGSNVTIDSNADLGSEFSVCTYAQADASVVSNDETRILLATESAVLQYNGTDNEWQGYYYNVSSRNSYRTAVAASSPSTPTLVCLNAAGSYINVTANTTSGPNTVTTASNIAAYPQGDNWDGTVEETRLYGTPLTSAQRSEWVNDPVLALDGITPAARVTYDTRASSIPSTFPAYFGDGTATPSNAALATGRGGPSVTEGADYSVSGDAISVLGGGTLDENGEVLYVEYDPLSSGWAATLTSASQQFQSTFSLLNLIPFLLVAFLVIAMMRL